MRIAYTCLALHESSETERTKLTCTPRDRWKPEQRRQMRMPYVTLWKHWGGDICRAVVVDVMGPSLVMMSHIYLAHSTSRDPQSQHRLCKKRTIGR